MSKQLGYYLTLLFSFHFFSIVAFAQTNVIASKPIIDSASVKNWPYLSNSEVSLSNNANFLHYVLYNRPSGHSSLIVQSIKDLSCRAFIDARPICFSNDESKFFFVSNDTIVDFNLSAFELKILDIGTNVKCFKSGSSNFITYMAKNKKSRLIVFNVDKNKSKVYDEVRSYAIDEEGKMLLIQTRDAVLGDTVADIKYINLSTLQATSIWSAKSHSKDDIIISKYAFHPRLIQMSFIIGSGNATSIWYYKDGMRSAEMKVDAHLTSDKYGLSIAPSSLSFSRNGDYIFFALQRPIPNKLTGDAARVDVWNYKDFILQPRQDLGPPLFMCALNINSQQVTPLESDTERLCLPVRSIFGNCVATSRPIGDRYWDKSWSDSGNARIKIRNLRDGNITTLPMHGQLQSSPSGNYLVCYSSTGRKNRLYSVNLRNYSSKWISTNIADSILYYQDEFLIDSAGVNLAIGFARSKAGSLLDGWVCSKKRN
jgi:hypothetical protein